MARLIPTYAYDAVIAAIALFPNGVRRATKYRCGRLVNAAATGDAVATTTAYAKILIRSV